MISVFDDCLLREKTIGMARHPSVDKLGQRGAVLDGKVFKGHFWIRQVTGQPWLPNWEPPELGVEAAVVEGLEEQSQEVREGQSDEQGQPIGLCADRVPVTPPSRQQDASISGDEGMVDDAPASGPTLGYIKPAEVPNEADSGPVEPLPAGAVHEVCPQSPGPQHKDTPEHQKVGCDVPAKDRGEEGEDRYTWGDKQEVPQEVD